MPEYGSTTVGEPYDPKTPHPDISPRDFDCGLQDGSRCSLGDETEKSDPWYMASRGGLV